MTATMSRAEFERVVGNVIDNLPDWVVEQVDNLHFFVEERPTTDQDPDGMGLLGLYEGISLLERSAGYFGTMPDKITIFRQPHLRLGLEGEELEHEIRKTVLHEVAHHVGIDDDRLHELGWD